MNESSGWRLYVRPALVAAAAALGYWLLWDLLVNRQRIDGPTAAALAIALGIGGVYVGDPWRGGRDRSGGPDGPPEDGVNSQVVARYLLVMFGSGLLLAGMAAVFVQPPVKPDVNQATTKDWLDVFKSGFLLLGGGLTTIIGYYFGSRQTQKGVQEGIKAGKEAAGGSPDGPINGPFARPLGRLNSVDDGPVPTPPPAQRAGNPAGGTDL